MQKLLGPSELQLLKMERDPFLTTHRSFRGFNEVVGGDKLTEKRKEKHLPLLAIALESRLLTPQPPGSL